MYAKITPPHKEAKTFAIIALGFLGDTILVEPLCQNIRNNYPNSKIVFIANDLFKETALGFESINEVFGYEKRIKHKGLMGLIRFSKEFPYKNKIDYAIITHPHERSILLAKIIGAKNIISLPSKNKFFNLFFNPKNNYIEEENKNTYKADYNLKCVESLFKPQNMNAKYIRKDIDYNKIKEKFNLPDNYVALSPTSKEIIKDWDYRNIKEFIEKSPLPVVLIGTKKANEIAKKLKEENITFIDLTNKTTITELGAVIKMADTCVSVDTGTFHFSYVQGVKTIGLFFNDEKIKEWVPMNLDFVKILKGKKLEENNEIVCIQDITADNVLKEITANFV